MIGMIRLAVFGFLAVGVIYLMVSFYSRSVRKEKLEKKWVETGSIGSQEDFVKEGLKAYDGSLRRKALLLIFIVPVVLVAMMLYITNFM
jgi:Ca2+/Na+ antiporter